MAVAGNDEPPVRGGPLFKDRRDAGRRLARRVAALSPAHPVVLGLPRGGVPVAFEIARSLGAPMDVMLVRKIGAPGHPELALGAVMDGVDPQLIINEDVARAIGGDLAAYVNAETTRQFEEIEQRRMRYRGGRAVLSLAGRDVILVDDGVATGATLKAALKGLRGARPRRIIAAIPVAPAETVEELKDLADDFICLASPDPFHAVSLAYESFPQTDDREVVQLLQEAAESAPPAE
ncbi:MAG TPA: phosphoribosyltransferase [Parvularculaceae bacterium]|nr:phosphoribosyltransferase [Parvularculaceae bacterium]